MDAYPTIIRTAFAVLVATRLAVAGAVDARTAAGMKDAPVPPRIIVKLAPAVHPAIFADNPGDTAAIGAAGGDDLPASLDVLLGEELVDDFPVAAQSDLQGPVYLLELPATADVAAAVATVRRLPVVDYAEPEYPIEPFSTGDNPLSSHRRCLHNTGKACFGANHIDGDDNDTQAPQSETPDAEIEEQEDFDGQEDMTALLIDGLDTDVDIDLDDSADDIGIDPDEDVDDDGPIDPEEANDADDDLSAVPTVFALQQNYPNPFNPTTIIRYALPRGADVTLTVYDVLGQSVAVLVDGPQDAGPHAVVWDGRDQTGRQAASGVYIYRLEAEEFAAVKKMVLVK